MYKSIINADKKDPVFPQNYNQKEVTHSKKIINNPSSETGMGFISERRGK